MSPAVIPLQVIPHDSRVVERPPDLLRRTGETGWSRAGNGSILLHTGPVGVDPLAGRLIDGTLHLARYPATLAALPPRAPLDLATLRSIAKVEYPEGTGSCFSGVFRVPAGMEIEIDPAGTMGDASRWWQFPPEPTRASPVDLWRALVDQCAALMTRSGDCAVLLSGGLDSSAVAAAAAQAAREGGFAPPLLLSVVYPGLRCDESSSQEMVARHLDLPLVQEDATRLELWPSARDAIHANGIPVADLQSAATSGLLRAARERGRNLVLMGLGGDALFAGDGAELELYRRGQLLAAHRFFRDWGVAGNLPARVLWYRRGLRRHLLGHPFGSRKEIAEAGTANRAGLRRALSHPAHGWRAEMIEGTIEPPAPTVGCPLYGGIFLEAFAQVRAVDLARGPGFKGLLRQVARPHLPAAVAERQRKANFHDFYPTWIGRERELMVRRYESVRRTVPDSLGLPLSISPQLTGPDFPAGLLSAWFCLCLAEFFSAWNS